MLEIFRGCILKNRRGVYVGGDFKPRTVGDLYAQASVWAIRGLLLFGMWALTEIYSGIRTRLDHYEQRLNTVATAVARIEARIEAIR